MFISTLDVNVNASCGQRLLETQIVWITFMPII